jgi:hypothetical protein
VVQSWRRWVLLSVDVFHVDKIWLEGKFSAVVFLNSLFFLPPTWNPKCVRRYENNALLNSLESRCMYCLLLARTLGFLDHLRVERQVSEHFPLNWACTPSLWWQINKALWWYDDWLRKTEIYRETWATAILSTKNSISYTLRGNQEFLWEKLAIAWNVTKL